RNLTSVLTLEESNIYHSDNHFLEDNAEIVLALTPMKTIRKVSSGKGLHLTTTKKDTWIDVEEQKARSYLTKLIEKSDVQRAIADQLEAKLKNKGYTENAPKEVVDETKEKLSEAKDLHKKLEREVKSFKHALK
ncbi:MAG: hypothetical protein HKN32_07960, partial [Flavobacteriales bacterium]|nr:hypothetical protein [Flavobacteriales bacterium]